MAKPDRHRFIQQLGKRASSLHRLPHSTSLFVIGDDHARLYVRYSKLHPTGRTFFGLRQQDLHQLSGHTSFIAFVWEGQSEPLIVPFEEYEEVFNVTPPAGDGQYKAQVFLTADATELYIARAGRFNVEDNLGWDKLDAVLQGAALHATPDLSHSQVQTLLGAIGTSKGYQIWIPPSDRGLLDWSLTHRFDVVPELPTAYRELGGILQEVDVVWLRIGSSVLCALYEVEHSTPIYSGLLRFNDIHLIQPSLAPRFNIVANADRRSRFARQLNRPTFKASGLNQLCSFLRYENVFAWHQRLSARTEE